MWVRVRLSQGGRLSSCWALVLSRCLPPFLYLSQSYLLREQKVSVKVPKICYDPFCAPKWIKEPGGGSLVYTIHVNHLRLGSLALVQPKSWCGLQTCSGQSRH